MRQILTTIPKTRNKEQSVYIPSKSRNALVRYKRNITVFSDPYAIDFIDDKLGYTEVSSRKDKCTKRLTNLDGNYWDDRGFDRLNKFGLRELFNKDGRYDQETYYV